MALKIIGALFFIIGLIDIGGTYGDFDLWGGFLGIQLPELLWKFSGYIELGIGALLFNLAPDGD